MRCSWRRGPAPTVTCFACGATVDQRPWRGIRGRAAHLASAPTPAVTVLVLEGWGNRLSRVSSSGISQVLAGTGRPGFSGDGGPAISADIDVGFVPLAGVVRTVTGATVFTDSLNQRVRRIQPGAMIETIAGSGPAYGGLAFSCQPTGGDGGPAVAATLCAPNDALAEADGGLIIADTGTTASDGSRRTERSRRSPAWVRHGSTQARNGSRLPPMKAGARPRYR